MAKNFEGVARFLLESNAAPPPDDKEKAERPKAAPPPETSTTLRTSTAPKASTDSTQKKRVYKAPKDRPHRDFSDGREIKTQRANFLLRPSTYEKFKEIAAMRGLSLNDAADEALNLYYGHFGRNPEYNEGEQ